MALNFFKFWKGINLKPNNTSENTNKGDLEVVDSTNRLMFHDGSSNKIITLQSASLTNQRIPFVDSVGNLTDSTDLQFEASKNAIKATGGLILTVPTAKTSTTTLNLNEEVIRCDASGGSFTVNLPTAIGNAGKVYSITKIDSTSNVITIDAFGSQTIYGDLTITLTDPGQAVRIVSDGSDWVNAGGGGAGGIGYSLIRRFVQTGHGFSVGNVIAFTSSTWNLCNVQDEDALGVVSKVIDANTFEVCFSGYLSGLSGLTPNTKYFCSTTGTLVTVPQYYEQVIAYSISSTELIINIGQRKTPEHYGLTVKKQAATSFVVTSGNQLIWPRVEILTGVTITLNAGSEMIAKDIYGAGSVVGPGSIYPFS